MVFIAIFTVHIYLYPLFFGAFHVISLFLLLFSDTKFIVEGLLDDVLACCFFHLSTLLAHTP